MAEEGLSPNQKKAKEDGGVVLFEDECVFRQEGTVCRTWAPVGEGAEVKSKPCRRTAKAYGAVRIDPEKPKLHFRFEPDTFNGENFILFLKQLLRYYRAAGQKVYLILDGASYHKKVKSFASDNAEDIELHFLPPYSPDLNPQEGVWKATKKLATHNRYFETLRDLIQAVFRRFNRFQGNPNSLKGIIQRWL